MTDSEVKRKEVRAIIKEAIWGKVRMGIEKERVRELRKQESNCGNDVGKNGG